MLRQPSPVGLWGGARSNRCHRTGLGAGVFPSEAGVPFAQALALLVGFGPAPGRMRGLAPELGQAAAGEAPKHRRLGRPVPADMGLRSTQIRQRRRGRASPRVICREAGRRATSPPDVALLRQILTPWPRWAQLRDATRWLRPGNG